MYIIDKMPHGIDIGYTGETGFRTIEIDMTPWMEKVPDGVPSIVAIRPGETMDDAYVAATSFDGKVLTWQIIAGDIGPNEGDGLIQIWLEKYANNSIQKRGKSKKVVTHVSHAINHASDEVPASQEAFIEQITVLKTQIVDNATAAVNSAVSAEASANRAENAVDHPPQIGDNGNWLVWDIQTEQYIDTGVHATGIDVNVANHILVITDND